MRLLSLTADNYSHGAFSYSFRSFVHSCTNSHVPSWSHSWEDNQKQKVLLLCLWLLGEWSESCVRGLSFLCLFVCLYNPAAFVHVEQLWPSWMGFNLFTADASMSWWPSADWADSWYSEFLVYSAGPLIS